MRMGLKQYPLTQQSQLHRPIYDPSLCDLPGMYMSVGMEGMGQHGENCEEARWTDGWQPEVTCWGETWVMWAVG